MSEEQCRVAFPETIKDIDDNVRKGPFTFKKSNPDFQGLVQGRIAGGKVLPILWNWIKTRVS
jgi:hypothetical protein